MKKFIAMLLALVMALSLVACGGGDNQQGGDSATGDKVVKIGVFEPQSGDNGAGGKQEILGMQYANKMIPTVTIGGEEYKVELVYADNASSNDKAPTAAQTLISEGVSVVLGSYGSGVSIAAGDTFSAAQVPAIGVTCTNPQVTSDCDAYFRICFLDPFQGTVLANYAKNELKATKAYCLAKQGDDYSGGLANYFIQAFGQENCVYEQFPEGTSDFSTYITNAQQQGCDVFFSPVSLEAAAQIIAKAETQNLGMPILAGDTWDSNVVLEAAKGTSLEICVTTFYQEGVNAEFDAAIKEWINSDSTAKTNNGGNDVVAAVSALGYDAYMTAVAAIEKAQSTDGTAIRDALAGLSIDAVTGSISFDANGDAIKSTAYIKQAIDGGFQFCKVQNAD